MVNKLGGRKVIAGMIVLLCGIGALLLKGDIPLGFLTLLQTIFGAFVVGNAIEHVSGAVKSNAEAKIAESEEAPVVTVDNTELTAKMEKLDSDINGLSVALGVANQSLSTVQQAISYVIQRAFPDNKPPR